MAERWDRWGPLTGIAMVVLFLGAGVLTGNEPKPSASGATVIAFYGAHKGRLEVGGYLLGLAVVTGMFFYGYLREHIRVQEGSPRLAAISFGGVVIFALSGLVGAGTSLALAEAPGTLAPAAAQALNLMQNFLVAYAFNVGAAVLLIASGLAIVRGHSLPRWVGWLALVLALLAFVPLPNAGVPAVGVWTLVVGIVLLVRTRRADIMPAARTQVTV